MYKKRHVDNHLEYLQVSLIPQTQYHSEMGSIINMNFQGKRTYAETYEAPPKAHAYTEPWFDAK